MTRMVIDFIQMLPLLFIAAICGAFSAQLGLMLVTGFALGDLLPAAPAFDVRGHSLLIAAICWF